MKILIVCQYYYPENFVITKIAEQLAANGNKVDVLTAKPNYGYGRIISGYENISEQTINEVNVHRVNIYPRKNSRISIIRNYISFWRNSKKWVRHCDTDYDVVYTMSLSPVTMCSAGNLYKKLNNTKHIIHCVDLWPESPVVTKGVKYKSLMYYVLLKWSKKIYSKADKILIGSPSFAEYFENILGISSKNLYYVPQCAINESIDFLGYNFGEGTNLVYCGNLGYMQLIPLLIDTMKIIDDKNIFLHLIGMGSLKSYVEKEIKNSGLTNVIYHGPMNAANASIYLNGADAHIVSLKNEGYVGKTIPNKLITSMAYEKPVIGIIQGDGRNILRESGGAVFADENPQSIKDAILALTHMNEVDKKMMGMRNRNYYLNNFSLKEVTFQIEKHLK